MAIYVKPAPVLTGKAAAAFVEKAEANVVERGSVDFSKEIEAAKRILERTKHSSL